MRASRIASDDALVCRGRLRMSVAVPPTDFVGSRVAILLIGEVFRKPKEPGYQAGTLRTQVPCNAVEPHGEQRLATQSLANLAIAPLEAAGAQVSVLMTIPWCRVAADAPVAADVAVERQVRAIRRWLTPESNGSTPSRLVDHRVVNSTSVSHSWYLGYTFLEEYILTRGTAFDYVLRARHDIRLVKEITAWPADFSKAVFQMRCLECPPDDRSVCRNHSAVDTALQLEPGCRVVTDDHLLWTPRASLAALLVRLHWEWDGVDRHGKTRQAEKAGRGSGYTHFFAAHACDTCSCVSPALQPATAPREGWAARTPPAAAPLEGRECACKQAGQEDDDDRAFASYRRAARLPKLACSYVDKSAKQYWRYAPPSGDELRAAALRTALDSKLQAPPREA